MCTSTPGIGALTSRDHHTCRRVDRHDLVHKGPHDCGLLQPLHLGAQHGLLVAPEQGLVAALRGGGDEGRVGARLRELKCMRWPEDEWRCGGMPRHWECTYLFAAVADDTKARTR